MFKRLILLIIIVSSYFASAEELVVTPAMIVSGTIEIESPTVTKITFAEGDYTSLRELRVHGNTSLTSLVIPNTLIALRELNASENTSLTSLVIPNTLTALTSLRAYDNTSLTSLVIPNTLTALTYLFASGNTSLTSLVIPNTPYSHDNLRGSINILSCATKEIDNFSPKFGKAHKKSAYPLFSL